jgi:hypothetical protein
LAPPIFLGLALHGGRFRVFHLHPLRRAPPPGLSGSGGEQHPFDYWPWLASTLLQPRLSFVRFACRQPVTPRTSLGFLCNSARQNLLTS